VIRGIIAAATAMHAQVLNQEVIANNLANVGTPAYQKDKAVFQSFDDRLMYRFEPYLRTAVGRYSGGSVVQEVKTMSCSGPVEVTGNPLDILLPEGAYLKVQTESGVRYTRRGDLELSGDGFLTVAGYKVLGKSGPLQLESSADSYITENAAVISNGEELDVLDIVIFSAGARLVKEGSSLFRLEEGLENSLSDVNITPGVLEKSSVDPVTEMINLISAMRTYEAAQRALKSHDETLEQAVNRVGKV